MSQSLLNASISSGSAVTRQFSNQVIIPDNFTAFSSSNPVLVSQFAPDPNNPFFYLFSGGAMVIGLSAADLFAIAGRTDFQFTNGGSIVSNASVYFGDGAALDTPANVGAMVATASLGIPIIYFHDPISGTCPSAGFSSDATGIVSKWSSLCDSVSVKSYLLGARDTGVGAQVNTSFTLMHGLIQQPW